MTSIDETDLLLPLFTGLANDDPVSEFLKQVKRRSGAQSVSLVLKHGSAPTAPLTHFEMPQIASAYAEIADPFSRHALERQHYEQLRPRRVYSVAEFTDHDPVFRTERLNKMAKLGIGDERVVRLSPGAENDAWLILSRAGACGGADSALLSSLAPYVEAALGSHMSLQDQRLRASVSAQGMAHSATAWMVLDHEARLLSIDPRLSHWLQDHLHYLPRIGERLRDLGISAERELASAAALLTSDDPPAPLPILLHDDPRLEALLTATRDTPVPAVLALCRLPHARTTQSTQRLATLFDLPVREAELAIALNEGRSIAEAAAAMGLTLETARNYSKRLYAKLGVRGQAELVRLVSDSVAVMG